MAKASFEEKLVFKANISSLYEDTERYLNERISILTSNYLQVFQGRLGTILDEPDYSPSTVAMVEYDLLVKNLKPMNQTIKMELLGEVNDKCAIAKKSGHFLEYEKHLDSLIALKLGEIESKALAMVTKVLAGLYIEES